MQALEKYCMAGARKSAESTCFNELVPSSYLELSLIVYQLMYQESRLVRSTGHLALRSTVL